MKSKNLSQEKRNAAKQHAIVNFDGLPDSALVSIVSVAGLLSQGVSTVWRKVATDPSFPKPIKLSQACTRFEVGDVRRYLDTLKMGPKQKTSVNGNLSRGGFDAE